MKKKIFTGLVVGVGSAVIIALLVGDKFPWWYKAPPDPRYDRVITFMKPVQDMVRASRFAPIDPGDKNRIMKLSVEVRPHYEEAERQLILLKQYLTTQQFTDAKHQLDAIYSIAVGKEEPNIPAKMAGPKSETMEKNLIQFLKL